MTMTDSILKSIKKLLGIPDDYEHFNTDLIICINTALAILTQLGVGPSGGFSISDDTAEWFDFIGEEKQLNDVVTYVHLKTKLIFDPPSASSVIDSYERILKELEYRINVTAESLSESE